MNKIVESLTQKFAGRVITKAVTVLATYLIAHKFLSPAQSTSFIEANSDLLSGLLLSALSFWLSHWQHKQTEQAKAVALYSEPPAAPAPPEVAAKLPTFGGPTRTLPLLAAGLLAAGSLATASEPAPVTNPESAATIVRALVSSVGERIDLGGTFTAKPTARWANAPSVSVLGKLPGCAWDLTDRITVEAGLGYSYVLQWEEHYAGAGVAVTLFDTPQPVLATKDALPVASAVLPRMTKIKAFLSVQTRVPEPLLGLTAGLTVPF